jgi:hypothetical protein
MQINKLEKVKRGFNELVAITPRMLSEEEASVFDERMAEIADTDEARHEKRYHAYLDFLCAAAVEVELLVKDKDEKTKKEEMKTLPLSKKAETPEAALREYFAEYNPLNLQVVRWLYNDISLLYIPKRDF